MPPVVIYATVHKERGSNRVVFETAAAVAQALVSTTVSRSVNTCFVERHNGTDRNRCSREVRKNYGFSKDWEVYRAATVLSCFSYNFCWSVRTLCAKAEDGDGGREPRRWPPG